MMGYRMPPQLYAAGHPGQMYVMGSAVRTGQAAPLSNRLPQPANAGGSESNATGGAAAARVSSVAGDAGAPVAQSSGTSKSKQGLEKILDTLSRMFPDVRRLVTAAVSRCVPLPSSRHHLSYDEGLKDKRGDLQNCSVLYCVLQFCTVIRTHIRAVLIVNLLPHTSKVLF